MFNFLKKQEKQISTVEALAMYVRNYPEAFKKSFRIIIKNVNKAIELDELAVEQKKNGVCTYTNTELLRDDSLRIVNMEISCLNISVKRYTGVDMGLSIFCDTNDEVMWIFQNFFKRVEALKSNSMMREFLESAI